MGNGKGFVIEWIKVCFILLYKDIPIFSYFLFAKVFLNS